jgi:Sortase and related acyltransferases
MIRPARLSDSEAIAEIYAPYCTDTVISFEIEAPPVDEIRQRMEKVMKSLPWLVEERDGKVVGYAYASPHRERLAYQYSVEVSVYIDKNYHKQGIGKALYMQLFEQLRELGKFNALAGITLPNQASVGLHEHLGFLHTGTYSKVGYKFGAWHDVGWWQLVLQPYEKLISS